MCVSAHALTDMWWLEESLNRFLHFHHVSTANSGFSSCTSKRQAFSLAPSGDFLLSGWWLIQCCERPACSRYCGLTFDCDQLFACSFHCPHVLYKDGDQGATLCKWTIFSEARHLAPLVECLLSMFKAESSVPGTAYNCSLWLHSRVQGQSGLHDTLF